MWVEFCNIYVQYYCCWYPGDTRDQGISSHVNDLVNQEHCGFQQEVMWQTYSNRVIDKHFTTYVINALQSKVINNLNHSAFRYFCIPYLKYTIDFLFDIHLKIIIFHKIMMTSSKGNVFHVTGPLWGESTGHRWLPLTEASDVEH